ncbi:MAG TPA: nitroreductase family deazaflavin-dependent oxidoreductase [Dermatophilaceae bacterium]|jgi:deazaflavin-dependent oxidoreductase (nitroreductase family)|nr:nitroreductase family deazaflavin-dependent oxidoreductase [Dermatophilaceae bacterium]
MPIPDRMRQVNKVALNKVTGPLAQWLPGLGVVVHRGRKTGRPYRTPVNVFPRPAGRYVLALTYGSDTDWVKNVMAAGGCELLTRGKHIELTAPRLFHDEDRSETPVVGRTLLGLLHVYDFLELRTVPDA